MAILKYTQPLSNLKEILSATLFSEEERIAAINRCLSEEGRINQVFKAVFDGETTFEKYVQEYAEDNMGLGLFKRWKLNNTPTKEFVENISVLFDTEKSIGCRVPLYKNLATEEVRGPKIFLPLVWTAFAFSFLSLAFFARGQIGILAWTGILSISSLLAVMTFWAADHPFEDQRNMGANLLSQARELDMLIQKYWAPSTKR